MDARVEAIDFLKEKLEDTGPLNARSLARYLSHTTESIRKTAGRNPDGVLDFVRSDPNTFLVSNDGTIFLVPSKTTEDKAIQLLRKVLWEKEQMVIKNLVGYLSNVPGDVREKAGKNIQGVTAFLLEHPEVFHVSDDDRSVECTTSAFLDSLSEDLTCTDDEAIPLNVVDILMGHGVSNSPIQDLFQCLNSRLECSCTSHTCIANVKSTLSESDLFHVDRSGLVTLKLDKLNAERLLTMFMCAILEDKGLLSLGDLLVEVSSFKLATVLGVNTVFGLSEFVNQDTFVKFGNMVGLAGDSEIEALEFLYDVLKRRGRYPIQKLTGYLSQASESVKDVIVGLTELRTLLIEHDDVFLVTDDDHVMIPDSEEVVRYFKEKLETKKEIALRNVHSFINNSPEEVKYFASHGTDRILQVLLSRKDTFRLTRSDTLTLTPNQPTPLRSSNSPEKLKSPTVSLTPKQPTPIRSSNSPEKLKSPTVSLTPKQPTPIRSSNSPEKLKSPTASLTPKQPTPIRSSNSPEKLKSPTSSSMKSTFKGTVKQLHSPYGTIRITEGKLLDQEVYFNTNGCIFADNGQDLTECLSKGQALRFYLQKGIPNGKYDWCAYNVEKVGSHVVSPSQQNGTVPDKSKKSVTPSKLVHGEVQLKILKHTTLLLLRREELSFEDILLTLREIIPEGKKELASEASFVQILSNSELFQIGKKTVGLAVELSEGYVTTLQTDGGLIRESKHKNTVAFQKSAVYIPPETHVTNQLDYELKVNSSVKYIALPAHSKSAGFPHARAIIVWPSEGPNLKKLQSQLAASPGKSKAGAISGGASNAIASTPDKVLYGSTSSITSNTSTGSSSVVNEHLEILKEIVILLLSNGAMAIGNLYCALEKKLEGQSTTLVSTLEDLKKVLLRYDIFLVKIGSVVLKVRPSEGCISKNLMYSGFINNTSDKKDVFYRRTAVYVPPGDEQTKEKAMFNSKTRVKYIAVNVSSLPEKIHGNQIAPLRAVLVWPKDGTDPSKVKTPGFLACKMSPEKSMCTESDRSLHGSSSSLASSANSDSNLINEHLEVLKGLVILLLSCGKMTVNQLHKAWEKTRTDAAKPMSASDLQKLIRQYDIFCIESEVVGLKAKPKEGSISKIIGKNIGFINKTLDDNDVFFVKSALYIPFGQEHMQSGMSVKENTIVRYIAVKVFSLPGKVTGNRICPYRGVLVWATDGPDPAEAKWGDMPTENKKERKASNETVETAPKKSVEGTGSFSKGDRENPPDAESVQRLSQYEKNASHLRILKSAVLFLQTSECVSSLTEMWEFLKMTLPSGDLEQVTSLLRQFLSKHTIFVVMGNTVALRYSASKGYVSHVAGGNEAGFIGKTSKEKDIFFESAAVASSGKNPSSSLTKETRVNYIAVPESEMPYPWDHISGCPWRGILVWPEGSSIKAELTSTLPDTDDVTNLLDPETDLTCLVFIVSLLLLNKHGDNGISRLALAEEQGLPTAISDILSHYESCRRYVDSHSFLLKLDEDGETISLVCMPSNTALGFHHDAKVVAVCNNSALAGSPKGRVYIARIGVFHCGDPGGTREVSRSKLKSALQVGDIVTCLTVPYQIPESVPTLPGADQATLQAVLTWPSHYNHIIGALETICLQQKSEVNSCLKERTSSSLEEECIKIQTLGTEKRTILDVTGDEQQTAGPFGLGSGQSSHDEQQTARPVGLRSGQSSHDKHQTARPVGLGSGQSSHDKQQTARPVGLGSGQSSHDKHQTARPVGLGSGQSSHDKHQTARPVGLGSGQSSHDKHQTARPVGLGSGQSSHDKQQTAGPLGLGSGQSSHDKQQTAGPVGPGSGQSSHDKQQTAGPVGPGSGQSSHDEQQTAGPLGPGSGQSSHDIQQTAGPLAPGSGQSSHDKQQTAGSVGPGSGQSSHDIQQTVGPLGPGSGQSSHNVTKTEDHNGARGLERSPDNTGPTTENSSEDTKPFHQNAAVSQNHVGDQTWCRNIPEKPNPTILLTLIVACLKRKGILIEEAMDLLNRCVVLKNIRFSEDSFCLYLAHYNHVFEVLDDKIHLVGQFTPSKYIVKTSGTVVRIQNGQMFLKADSESCQTVTCPDRIFREVDCSDREVCVGDVIHFIATSYDHKSQLWEVLFAWPADVILESTEEFLLQIDSSSESGSCSTSGKHEVCSPSFVTKEGHSPISEISGKGTTGATDSFDEEERGLDSFSGNSQAKTKPEENTSFAPGHGKFQFLPQNDQLSVGSSDITGTHDKFDSGDVEYPQATEPSKSITASESTRCLGNMPVGRGDHHSVEDVHDIPMEADIPSALNLTNSLNEITGNILQSVTALVNTIESDKGGCWTEQGKKVKDILGSLLNARQELEHKRSHFQKMNSDVGEKPKQYIQQWLDKTETCGTAPDDTSSFDTCCSTTENLSNICHGETRSDPQKQCSDLDTTNLSFVTRNSEGKKVSRESFFTETSPKESFTDGELKSKLCQESKLDGIPLTVIKEDFPKGDVNYQGLPLQATVESFDKGCQADSTPVHSIQTQTSCTPVLNAASQTSSTGHVIITRYVQEKSGRSPSLPK